MNARMQEIRCEKNDQSWRMPTFYMFLRPTRPGRTAGWEQLLKQHHERAAPTRDSGSYPGIIRDCETEVVVVPGLPDAPITGKAIFSEC